MFPIPDRLNAVLRLILIRTSPALFLDNRTRGFLLFVARGLHSQVASVMTIVKPGNVVIDVGANTGGYTILFGHLVGSQGSVHAFEPVRSTYVTCTHNIRKSRLWTRIRINNFAVGDRQGVTRIYMPGYDSTEASLVRHDFASWRSSMVAAFECRLETLDNYISSNNIPRVDFVKIDVEGAELSVLRGMRTALTGRSPPILMLEFFPLWMKDFSYTVDDLFSFVTGLGYEFYFMGRDGLIHCRNPIEASNMIRFPEYVDFICIIPRLHKQKISSLLAHSES